MTDKLIVPLSTACNESAAAIGAKALTLSRLERLGVPVPTGFVLTTAAYISSLGGHSEFRRAIAAYDQTSATGEDRQRACQQIREAILSIGLRPGLEATILSEWRRLASDTVAVRSSATVEDLPNASFAGQYESFLNVRPDDLSAAVRRCWASLWSDRAVAYRTQVGVETSDVQMAVIVQAMVPAKTSGVVFTANPVSSDLTQIVINRTTGLGEALVGGTTTGESTVIRKGDQVADPVLKQIASLALRIERALGGPQDIEWVQTEEDAVVIVQARPLTALLPEEKLPTPGVLQSRLGHLILEYFPQAPYPLDLAVALPLVQVTLNLAREFGLTPATSSDVIVLDKDGMVRLHPRLPVIGWRTPGGIVAGIIRALIGMRTSPAIWRAESWPAFRAELQARHQRTTPDINDLRLAEELQDSVELPARMFEARRPYFLGAWLTLVLFPTLLRLVFRQDARSMSFALAGDLNHPTSTMNAQLRDLARLAAATPDLLEKIQGHETTGASVEFTERFQRFLEEFGARTEVLVPLVSSTPWNQTPSHVLAVIAGLATVTTSHAAQKPDLSFDDAQSRLDGLGWGWRMLGIRRLLRFLARRDRVVREERDWIIYGYERAIDDVRRLVGLAATRLANRGLIASAGDIRFLTLDEALALLGEPVGDRATGPFRDLIAGRRAARPRSVRRWQLAAQRPYVAKGRVILRGAAASPGRAVGRARLITSDRDFARIREGDILVCQATSPAWTPLFAKASAVVTDVGGILSHAAIVAREYAIPAVLGTGYATRTLQEGKTYLVDGSKGVVEVVAKGRPES